MFALGEPIHTPYDIRFTILGCQVRVASTFWLVAALLGYSQARAIDYFYEIGNRDTPGLAMLLVVWMLALFVSILVHELGHYAAFRFFGIDSNIVLYHFGGLAIPTGGRRAGRLSVHAGRLGQYRQMIISAAGPAAQLLLALVVALVTMAFGLSLGSLTNWASWIGVTLPKGALPQSAIVFALIEFLIFQSIFWALFNLLPILPLDGGRIAEEIICIFFRGTQRDALIVSMITSILVAIWLFRVGNQMTAIFILSLAFSNFESLQSGGMRRPW